MEGVPNKVEHDEIQERIKSIETFDIRTVSLNFRKLGVHRLEPTENTVGLIGMDGALDGTRPLNNEILTVPFKILRCTLGGEGREMTTWDIIETLRNEGFDPKPLTYDQFYNLINNQMEREGEEPKIKEPLNIAEYNIVYMEREDGYKTAMLGVVYNETGKQWDSADLNQDDYKYEYKDIDNENYRNGRRKWGAGTTVIVRIDESDTEG